MAHAFTDPAITRDEMIAKVAEMIVAMKIMPDEQAKELASTFIPQLKR